MEYMPTITENEFTEFVSRLANIASKGNGESVTKYGFKVSNPIFRISPYCWCDRDDCSVCSGDEPNFIYSEGNEDEIRMTWYKYLGRSQTFSRLPTAEEFHRIEAACLSALGVPLADSKEIALLRKVSAMLHQHVRERGISDKTIPFQDLADEIDGLIGPAEST